MIPTAKEYFKGTFQNIVLEKHCEKIKEFAKLHVEAQAKAILEKVNLSDDKWDLILNAYPLDNIK